MKNIIWYWKTPENQTLFETDFFIEVSRGICINICVNNEICINIREKYETL